MKKRIKITRKVLKEDRTEKIVRTPTERIGGKTAGPKPPMFGGEKTLKVSDEQIKKALEDRRVPEEQKESVFQKVKKLFSSLFGEKEVPPTPLKSQPEPKELPPSATKLPPDLDDPYTRDAP